MNKTDLRIFNRLLRIQNDRLEVYNLAMKESLNPYLTAFLAKMASESFTLSCDLEFIAGKNQFKLRGGTTTFGKFCRFWFAMRLFFSGGDHRAILEVCLAAEEITYEAYRLASYVPGLTKSCRYNILRQRVVLRHSYLTISHHKAMARLQQKYTLT